MSFDLQVQVSGAGSDALNSCWISSVEVKYVLKRHNTHQIIDTFKYFKYIHILEIDLIPLF